MKRIANNKQYIISKSHFQTPHMLDRLFNSSNITVGTLYESVRYVLLYYNGTERLHQLGFPAFNSVEDVSNLFRNTLLRLLLNPVPRLCNRIHEEQKAMNSHFLSCFQVRMGGKLSNFRETTTFLDEKNYRSFVRPMHEYALQHGLYDKGMNLFVSSDSDHAITSLRNLTSNVTFFSLSNIHRGHTAYSAWNNTEEEKDVVFGSLLDLFLLQKCDMLITTCDSSYGKLAVMLQEPNSFVLPPLPEMNKCTVFTPKSKERIQFFVRRRGAVSSC